MVKEVRKVSIQLRKRDRVNGWKKFIPEMAPSKARAELNRFIKSKGKDEGNYQANIKINGGRGTNDKDGATFHIEWGGRLDAIKFTFNVLASSRPKPEKDPEASK